MGRNLLRKLSFTAALGVLWASAVYGQAKSSDQTQSSDPNQSSDQSQEYQGPSILSRDKSLIGVRGGKLIDFRFYAQVTGTYDSGLTPVAVDSNSNLLNVGASKGLDAGVGLIGSRRWKRDQLSVEYRGTYRHYFNNSFFNGIDQFLNLGYGRALTRTLNLNLRETLGTSSLSNGAYAYVPLTNTDLFAVPANELFDNRTNFVQSRVDMSWSKTARLSLGFGGQGFIVRRKSFSLAGLDGFAVHGDVSYRLTKRQTIGFDYQFSHFDFQRTFGDANLHQAAIGWNIGLGPRWQFGARAGGILASTRGLTQVSLNPAIAAIVGRTVAIVQYNRTYVVPSVELNLTRSFDRSSLNLTGISNVSPGNGVYLTSRQTALTAGYSYTGIRKMTLSATASYSQLSTLGQSLGKYKNYQGGVGATYKIANATSLEFRYDLRHYTTQNNLFRKNSDRFSLGLAFSPGERPIPIW